MNHVLRNKDEHKKEDMSASPRNITQLSQEINDNETQITCSRKRITFDDGENQVYQESDDFFHLCFGNLADSSSTTRIMSDMLRSAFASQVPSININRTKPLTNEMEIQND